MRFVTLRNWCAPTGELVMAAVLATLESMDPRTLAETIDVSVATLARWRVEGKGPRWCKIGGAVRYPREWVAAFMSDNARTSTSDQAA
jgi:hypothetical protein